MMSSAQGNATDDKTEEFLAFLPQLCTEFSYIAPEAAENDWYPIWNTILGNAFPYTENYRVALQYSTKYLHPEGIDEAVFFVVQRESRPVFFVELRHPSELKYSSRRDRADSHVREKLADFLTESTLPVLQGISAFGSIYAPYSLDCQTTRITPSRSTVEPNFASDPAPRERWMHEMQTDEGQEHFTALIKDVRAMVGTIPASPARVQDH